MLIDVARRTCEEPPGCSWLLTLVLLLAGGAHFRSTERVFAGIV
jgi:hypothetical protein